MTLTFATSTTTAETLSTTPEEHVNSKNNTNNHIQHTAKKPFQTSVPNMSKLTWELYNAHVHARQDVSCTILDDGEEEVQPLGVIMVGGSSTREPSLHNVEYFSWSTTKEWIKLTPLETPRCGAAVASLNQRVFVIGGVNGENHRVATCESLSINPTEIHSYDHHHPDESTSWNAETPMANPRWYAAAVSLPFHHDIVVLGGRDDRWQELDTVEVYDTRAKEWYPLSPMSSPRFACGATRIAPSKLLVAGGYNGSIWSVSAEIFCYETDEWTPVQSMPEPLQFCTASKLDEYHVLVTGRGASGVKMYVYDISKDTWSLISDSTEAAFLDDATISAVGNDVVVVDAHGHTHIAPNALENYNRVMDSGDNTSTSTSDDDAVFHQDQSIAPDDVIIFPPEPDQTSIYTAPNDDGSIAEDDHIQLSPRTSRFMLPDEVSAVDASGRSMTYRGEVSTKRMLPHGTGTMRWATGDIYTGGFRNGQLHGQGEILYANGDVFEGTFEEDMRHGLGYYRWKKDGRTYRGLYEDNRPHDPKGCMEWVDGSSYVGQFKDGTRTGKGTMTSPSSGMKYVGQFVNGKYEGMGKMTYPNGNTYKGEWVQGQAHGFGVLSDPSGKTIHNGSWERDEPVQ
eukprot:Nitzschia sp. Nitz4//scaffold215_size37433//24684//26555//NITZ4_007754-RA/size37433-processed-gene-0.51-mRNA-1//-1//CDS//3329542160//9142//frame0